MKEVFSGRKVLVTGGTGSIGSEVVRQLLTLSPGVVRVFSRDETRQYLLQEALGRRDDVRYLIGDVREKERLRRAMEGVDYVFHCAALKHVPSCEYNPFEAVKTNVVGTQNVIEAALDEGVRKVVAVSTDKAVAPCNTMGATKLLAEKIVAAANMWIKGTALACVRFGNVLGSRGSLVPLVREQIARGGPVTVTEPEMTRFMMSISQAVRLILTVIPQMEGGEVFILKMPVVRIIEMLRVLVEELSPRYGFRPEAIEVVEIGARPGEKIYEELMTAEEMERAYETDDMYIIRPRWNGCERQLAKVPYTSHDVEPLAPEEVRALLRQEELI